MTSQSVNSADASDTQLIVFPPDRGIGVLAVVPPYPVGFKPQTDGALGININLVHGDRDGLLVYILAYIAMAIGDTISVYIESKNAPVAEFSVTDAHFDAQGIAKNIPFYISAKDMESRFAPLQKQYKDFWFEVKRISGNTSEGSPPVPLFYKYPAPGEADTDGGKPFNQGLKLPVASESVVDKTVIDEGMFVTVLEYFNQHIGDVVVLAFGSLLLETTVTELGDVLFELLPEQLATLAPTNSLVVRWEVFDVVENASGWSDSLILTFKPGVVLLTAPIFEQADADNVLHHDRLVGGAANVLVTGVFSTSDVIDLTLQGFTKGGDPVIHIYSQTLAGSSRAVSFSFENERVRNLIGGTVRATYTLTKAGKAQQSKPADATIAGTSLPLGAPIITPLVDGKLPVDTVTATVQVADYWPLKSSAKVELRWQTTDQDGITTLFIFALIVTDPTQPVVFKVPARYIAPYAGAPLTVQNTITNPGQVEVFSELAQLMFGEDMKLNLLPPTVVGQSGNNFSPTLPEIRVLVPQGPLLPTDKLSVTWAGAIAVPAASYTSPQRLVSAGLEIAVPRSVLAYSLGKTVTVTYTVERNGVSTTSPPLTLNILPLPATALNPPKIVEADASNVLDIIALGTKNATIHALLHTLIETGQHCWLILLGKRADGTAHNLTLWSGYPAKVNDTWVSQGFWPAALANSYLKQLGHGTTLTIKYKVALDKSNLEANAVVFPDRVYTIKAVELVIPTLTNVLDDKGVEVLEAGFSVSTSLTLKGAASKGLQVEIFDGSGASAVSKGKATADKETGLWGLPITVPVGARRLYAKSLYHSTSVYSNVRTLTVMVLQPPTLLAPAVSPIDILAYPNGVTMRIEYPGALADNEGQFVVAGAEPFPRLDFNSNKLVDTVLSPAFLAARQVKEIEARWNLYRNGQPAGQSPVAKFSVLEIADRDSRFPTPNIDENKNLVLKVDQLVANSRILSEKWLLQEVGQPLWITCHGFDKNGQAITNEVRSGELNDSADGFSVAAPVEWLKELKEGTELKIECAIGIGRGADNAKPVIFPVRTYTVGFELQVEDFENVPLQYFRPGGKMITPKITAEFTYISGEPGAHCAVNPANSNAYQHTSKHLYVILWKDIFRITLNKVSSEVSFYGRALSVNTVTARAINTSGQVIATKNITYPNGNIFEFNGPNIAALEFIDNQISFVLLIDDIKFK